MSLPFGIGELRVASPAALLTLLAVPLFVVTARRARLAGACRAAAACAVVLALAGLAVERPRPEAGTCLVAALDVSASVQRAALETAREFLARIVPGLGADDLLGSVAFAGRARVVVHPASGTRSLAALVPADEPPGLEPDETDIGAALTTAASLCPESRQAAILLFTDGNETAGSLLAAAALAEPRVPVYPIVPPPARLPSATLRRLLAPSLAPARAVLPLEAVMESRAAAPLAAALVIRINGEALAPVPLEMPPGVSAVRLPYRFDDPGSYLLEAELLLPPGEPPAAGTVASPITVTGPVHVLVVSERERPVVALALVRRGMDVEATTPEGFSARSARLADYHLVILDDVGRAGLSDEALAALAARVAAGGGLIAAGGPHLFGDAGFMDTPLARILPVALQAQTPDPKEREPVALYLLIDRSNSMGYATSEPSFGYGEKMEYAKRAALAVLEQLGPRDLVGAIAFDSQPYELSPLVPLATGRTALMTRIRQLRYGGGTDFKDALETARRSLLAAGPRVRHIVLLTDGDTNRRAEDHDELIAELARDEITVTTIRIGSDTVNLDLLERISRATGGAFHHVEDVQALPQLMISDTQHVMDAAADRRAARARIAEPGTILAGIDEEELPGVSRWALSRPRPGADIRLYVDAAERRDPLLATWQHELGRVAVMPLDFQAGAAAWPTWRGFAKLWSQLAMWTAPGALGGARHLTARRLGDDTLVELTTVADEAGPFLLRLPRHGDVALGPTGPRTFAGVLSAVEPGVHPATLVARGREEAVDFAVPAHASSARELRALEANMALLRRVAALTGGRVEPSRETVLAARPGVGRRKVELDTVLIPLAIVLLLIDIAFRRFGTE